MWICLFCIHPHCKIHIYFGEGGGLGPIPRNRNTLFSTCFGIVYSTDSSENNYKIALNNGHTILCLVEETSWNV